jgi:hypothetical protein
MFCQKVLIQALPPAGEQYFHTAQFLELKFRLKLAQMSYRLIER